MNISLVNTYSYFKFFFKRKEKEAAVIHVKAPSAQQPWARGPKIQMV